MILVIRYIENFETNVIVFIDSVIMFDITLTDNFQCQSQFIDTDNITLVRSKDKCINCVNES